MQTENYQTSEEYEQMADEVIEEHEDLHWIRKANARIGYVSSMIEKQSNGRYVYGECMKVKEIYQLYAPYDFLIVLYEPNISHLDREQLQILLYHELLHVGISFDGTEFKIRPHDVEDFRTVLERYGLDWAKKKEK